MVCPKCRRVYSGGEQVCPDDGTPLVPEVDDLPTGFDDGTGPPSGTDSHPVVRQRGQPPTQKYPKQRRAEDTSTPIGREGSTGRSLTDSARHTPTGRELSSPRVVSQDLQIAPGDLIADYQVTGQLGEGGMGTVYAGIQPVIGKRVAIKVLLREFASNAEVVNRFIQEARAANQARSRYIVDIFSFGELNDGRHYFVMEHLDGKSLREVLKEKKVIAFDEAHAILTCLAKGLIAAHSSGIIHRDIKPENIMVITEEDGSVSAKLLDFGIAKLQGTMANPDFATKTGAAMGTPFYMSPEQCRGVDVDHRTDIYALGIIMFEMFAGQLPFQASSYIELVNKHLFASPPDMRSLNPELSAQLEAFVQRCIAKNPDERPSSMRQFLSELRELVPSLHQTHPSAVQLQPVTDVPVHADASVPSTVTGPGAAPARRGRLGLVLAVLAVIVLGAGGVGGYLVWSKGQGTTVGHGGSESAGHAAVADAAAPAKNARLKIVTTPAGATLFVRGKELPQKTPAEVELPPGPAPVRIVLEGHGAIERPLQLKAGETHVETITLTARPTEQAKTGGLSVSTNVRRATFYLDGKIVHQGEHLRLREVEARAYTLRITARGRRPLEQEITVLAGEELSLTLELRRRRGGGKPGKRPTPKKGTTNDDPDSTLNPFSKKR